MMWHLISFVITAALIKSAFTIEQVGSARLAEEDRQVVHSLTLNFHPTMLTP